MEYVPELNDKYIDDVYRHFEERLELYRSKGLDFDGYRRFILDKAGPIEGKILELGTGTGYTALMLAREGYKFVSIDTDEEALRTTAARLAHYRVLPNVKFYLMDATRLEFADGSFNSVVAVNLLHHLADPGKLLSEADRVLCPGGKMIISDFNAEGRRIIDSVHRAEGRSHDHPMADQEEIRSFFRDRGYGSEEFENTGHWILIAEKGSNG